MIIDEIFKALGYLVIAGIIRMAYVLARNAKGTKIDILWKGFLWCAGIALFTSVTLGDPSCIDSESDNRGTTCNEYADDGFEPTTEQRAANFAYYFVLLYVPAFMGGYAKTKEEIENEKDSKIT